ncbi:hypothetical protein BH24ACI1_BH24ACI1_21530 [soil metagenome]|jgi:hypothetical protein
MFALILVSKGENNYYEILTKNFNFISRNFRFNIC